jgi:hypothetical protein
MMVSKVFGVRTSVIRNTDSALKRMGLCVLRDNVDSHQPYLPPNKFFKLNSRYESLETFHSRIIKIKISLSCTYSVSVTSRPVVSKGVKCLPNLLTFFACCISFSDPVARLEVCCLAIISVP